MIKKPLKPTEPKPPSIKVRKYNFICKIYDSCSFQNLLDKLPNNVSIPFVDLEITIDNYYDEYGNHPSFGYYIEEHNKNYETEMIKYEKQLLDYKEKLKIYNEKKKLFAKQAKDSQKTSLQKELEIAEKRVRELKRVIGKNDTSK